MKLQPIVFGDADAPLFGIVTPATPSTAIDRGVLICAPIGFENVLHYRHLRVLARRLGESGRATLRFDWPACGDSSGDDSDPGLVAAWTQSVSDAAATLRERTGVSVVDVVGVRIGATLAALAAAADRTIGDLVLWAPFTSGRSYVREMRAFHRLAENTLPNRRSAEVAVDGQEISGFLLATTTLDDLDRVDLLATEAIIRQARALNPDIHVIVRAPATGDVGGLNARGADEVVQPEFEAGMEFVRQVLRWQGIGEAATDDVVAMRREAVYDAPSRKTTG